MTNFNPRSPDGERLHVRILACLLPDFNPRSPDGERPHRYDRASHSNYYFNPRSPDGERPPTRLPYECPARHFNPRSPDGERPPVGLSPDSGGSDFNPRSPDGERLASAAPNIASLIFQSTLPGWGATGRILGHGFPVGISIHAPRMGSDYI